MKGFAQRLVARSAGQPTGLPLLMPRPASRFETSEAPVLDEVIETAAPAEAIRVIAPVSDPDPVHAQAAGQPQGRPLNRSPEAEAPEHGNGMPEKPPPSEAPPSKSRAAPPDQSLPMASPQSPEVADIAAPHLHHAAKAASERPGITRRSGKSPVSSDQAMAAPPPPIPVAGMQFPPSADLMKPEQAAAPAISIGRIEVQFIAPERPAAAPRAEPQRTRGFDAYARARRGIPR